MGKIILGAYESDASTLEVFETNYAFKITIELQRLSNTWIALVDKNLNAF